jgi:hypothetical protein
MLKINEDGDGLYFAQFVEPIARPSATLLLAKYTWIFIAKSFSNASTFPNISIMYFVLSNTSQRTTKMLKINEDGDGLYFVHFLEPIARPSATLLLAK